MINSINYKGCEILPKFVIYPPDGSGRDIYIKKNNGGLLIAPKISKSIIGITKINGNIYEDER